MDLAGSLQSVLTFEKLGGLSSKGLIIHPHGGNDGIRIWETPSGIMNSVGLENPGIEAFIEQVLDWINEKDVVNIVNMGGHSKEDYFCGAERLNDVNIDILELNISCPNVKEGGMNFGVKTEAARELVREVRKISKHKLVVKLSPNAEDIVALAKMCEEEGADGVSLVNTFLAMAVDIDKKAMVFQKWICGTVWSGDQADRSAYGTSGVQSGENTGYGDGRYYDMAGCNCIYYGRGTGCTGGNCHIYETGYFSGYYRRNGKIYGG